MNGWLDWGEIERSNDWGLREKSDAMGARWDAGADMWDARWKADLAFTKRQADALDLLLTDTVIDLCCGAGPLTINVAPRVKRVIAQDFGEKMLDHVRENCAERGIDNVETLQGDWYDMEPGSDLPVCDVAITRWSPAQGDILKMSRCARRYCHSLTTCEPRFAENGFVTGGYWCRSTVDERQNTTPRPCGRKNGFNVHFNLLYDHGANPTVRYVTDEKRREAVTHDALLEKLLGDMPAPEKEAVSSDALEAARAFLERDITQRDDGTWVHLRRWTIAILGWNPNEIYC